VLLIEEILDRKGHHLYEVSPYWSVRKAVAMLAAWKIGTTLVTDVAGALVGIISERDIIRSLGELGTDLLDLQVSQLMTRSVITCGPEASIHDALSLMAQHRIRHLPVVQHSEILGLISIRDVLQYRAEALEEHFEALVRAEQESARAREAAELANRAKTQFLANISHELRTPLNAVIGFSDLIINGTSAADEIALSRQYATHINAAGRQLLKLVNEVLDLSKVVAGQFELHEWDVDLGALLRDCAGLVAASLAEKQLSLSLSVPQEVTSLTGDEPRLKQVLLNLLSNAIKFSHAGDVVKVRGELGENGDLTVAIVDHGVGMRPEDIPVALEPFRQLDSGLARTHGGTGLGLPLARMLVEKHGGVLSVDSAPGEGTSVLFTLPGWRVHTTAPKVLESAA
jgi:signal transduction histidine kinase